MKIEYEIINDVEYFKTTYNNEVIKVKIMTSNGSKLTDEAAKIIFQQCIAGIDLELSNLNSEDLTKEKNKTEQAQLVLVDLKKPVEVVGEV
tara:strand:+ start:1159 stop:1431 length:273 start_codon:yes stop_codon:yes gene_type:complete